MRLHCPIHLAPDGATAPRPGLHLSPRDALPQVGASSEWVHATLASPDPEAAWRWASRLRSLYVSVITERDQVPTVARLYGPDALLGEPAPRGDAWALHLSFDLADLLALPDGPYHLHLSTEHLRSQVQRREPARAAIPAAEPAASASGLTQLVLAYSLARDGDARGASHAFAAAFERPELRVEASAHAFNAACVAARVAARHEGRHDLVDYALAWLDEDLRLSEAHLLGVWRALAVAPDGPERRRLLQRRDALVAHLDARALDPDLHAVRDSDAWRARSAGR